MPSIIYETNEIANAEERQKIINYWKEKKVSADTKVKIAYENFNKYKTMVDSLKNVMKEFQESGDYDFFFNNLIHKKNKQLENLKWNIQAALSSQLHYKLQLEMIVSMWEFVEAGEMLGIPVKTLQDISQNDPYHEDSDQDNTQQSIKFWRDELRKIL